MISDILWTGFKYVTPQRRIISVATSPVVMYSVLAVVLMIVYFTVLRTKEAPEE